MSIHINKALDISNSFAPDRFPLLAFLQEQDYLSHCINTHFNVQTCEIPAFHLFASKWISSSHTECTNMKMVVLNNNGTYIKDSHNRLHVLKERILFCTVLTYQLSPHQVPKAVKTICDPTASCFP